MLGTLDMSVLRQVFQFETVQIKETNVAVTGLSSSSLFLLLFVVVVQQQQQQ
jgi:hypothetical protein